MIPAQADEGRPSPAAAYWRQRVVLALFARGARAYARTRGASGRTLRTIRRLAGAGAALVLAATAVAGAPRRTAAAVSVDPDFGSPSSNPFGLIDLGFYSAPAFADIDGDGDLDAFVGQSYGLTFFFRNTGSATTPAFAWPSANPFGLTTVADLSTPAFADMDNDGDLDAFVGGSDGKTVYFSNTGNATAPAFAGAWSSPFGLSDVGTFSAPSFADIDGDGDFDASIGERFGNTIFFRNTGTANAPAFATASFNPFGLSDVGQGSAPAFADIDGDGDLDAFIGEKYGNTVFFRNTGTANAPAFAASSANPFGLSDMGGYSTPAFADIDGDGDLDAFVGGANGYTVYFRAGLARRFIPSTRRSGAGGW